jgi:hypothetical protein
MQAGTLIATILRHDRKVASYKIALIRSINDVVLGYAHISEDSPVAIPLRMLASFWLAYYWPFTDSNQPIMQGRSAQGKLDISFRASMIKLRQEWLHLVESIRASDGFFLSNEFLTAHRRNNYPQELLKAYFQTLFDISDAIQQPIRYAGPGEYSVFTRPKRWKQIKIEIPGIVSIPNTSLDDLCLVIASELWTSFRDLSLWIEALCIHEWSLFTQSITGIDRGIIYSMLTDRPDNRRPLTWERNQIEILMMEGQIFHCPWTGKNLTQANYDLDHILPVSVYPINEIWNLVPSDRIFNQHTKRNRLPSNDRLINALPYLLYTYKLYNTSINIAPILHQDALARFGGKVSIEQLPETLTTCVAGFINTITYSRNLPIF